MPRPAPAQQEPILQVLGVAAPLPAEALAGLSAKAQLHVDRIQVNDQDLTGSVDNNVAMGTHSGNNAVSDGAFGDAAGFMTTIQNTGNNVLIQNATIVNISMQP